jgi:hypothetical protein
MELVREVRNWPGSYEAVEILLKTFTDVLYIERQIPFNVTFILRYEYCRLLR